MCVCVWIDEMKDGNGDKDAICMGHRSCVVIFVALLPIYLSTFFVLYYFKFSWVSLPYSFFGVCLYALVSVVIAVNSSWLSVPYRMGCVLLTMVRS